MSRCFGVICLIITGLLWHSVVINRSYTYPTRDESRLHNEIRKCEAAVVLFYDGSCRKTLKKTKKFQYTLTQLAQSGIYPRKALVFMSLDTTKPLTQLFMQDYNIIVPNVPSLVLFKNGV